MTETLAERWLRDAAIEIAPMIAAHVPYLPDPRTLRMRVGAVPGTRGTSLRVLGAFVAPSLTADGERAQIYISPLIDEPGAVLGTLAHEMCHWALPAAGRGREFARLCLSLGLDGPARATVPGAALSLRLAEIADALGAYPHSRLSLGEDGKPEPPGGRQTTRQLRHECPACGALFRATKKSPIPWCDGDTGGGPQHDIARTLRAGESEGE